MFPLTWHVDYLVGDSCSVNLMRWWFVAGATMVPISWTEMQCPLSGQIEQRKVAKVGA